MTLLTDTATAQEQRYRVELLVLTQLEHSEEPRETLQLPDYSSAIDFLTPAPEEDDDEENNEVQDAANTETTEQVAAEIVAQTLLEEQQAEEDINRVVHIEEMSSIMQESWRRLRLSAPFHPELYLSWEQGSEEPFPSLRVHDLVTVMLDDPWADLRAQRLEQATVFTDITNPGTAESMDEETEQPPIPDPIAYYRLDGTASLIRTRFLHLDLDLQLREALWDQAMVVDSVVDSVAEPSGVTGETEPVQPSSFLVYSMQQSRQVRTGQMEYFDGPVLGVLAYITVIQANKEDNAAQDNP